MPMVKSSRVLKMFRLEPMKLVQNQIVYLIFITVLLTYVLTGKLSNVGLHNYRFESNFYILWSARLVPTRNGHDDQWVSLQKTYF